MNNTRYFRTIIDTYPHDFHKFNNLKSFEIQFRKEAIYNDKLEIHSNESEPLSFKHEIKRVSDNISNCFSKVEWVAI